MYFTSVRGLGLTVAGALAFRVPVVTALLAWAFTNEFPTAVSISGGALIVTGVAFLQRAMNEVMS